MDFIVVVVLAREQTKMFLKSRFNSCCLTVVLTLPKGTGAQQQDGKGAVFDLDA